MIQNIKILKKVLIKLQTILLKDLVLSLMNSFMMSLVKLILEQKILLLL